MYLVELARIMPVPDAQAGSVRSRQRGEPHAGTYTRPLTLHH
jgi:hypothetical protein